MAHETEAVLIAGHTREEILQDIADGIETWPCPRRWAARYWVRFWLTVDEAHALAIIIDDTRTPVGETQ